VTFKTPPLEVLALGPEDYETPDHEEGFLIIRASKSDVQSAIHFWVASAQALGWQGRESYFLGFVENALCEPLTREGFAAIVDDYTQHSDSLRQLIPSFLKTLDGFAGGMRMSPYEDSPDVSAIAELADSFVAFFWGTTA
jgi:hypothetical protein